MQADPLPAETHRQLEQLVRHVRELDALVDELLSFARLQSSQQPPERLSLELEAFLDSVLADFAEEQERRGVVIHLDLTQAPRRPNWRHASPPAPCRISSATPCVIASARSG